MISKLGLFTPYTLQFHSDCYNEKASNLLKRSIILFDQMVYIAPRSKDSDFIEKIVRSETNNNFNEIMDCFRPISHFVDDEFISDMSFKVNYESNLCYGIHREEFIFFIKTFLTNKFGFDAFNVKNGEEFELLDYYVTALSVDFDFLFQLSKHNQNFSALYTTLHKNAYMATFAKETNVPERVLEKVCSINYFDFGELTWQQLLELKRSHFINDFRKQFLIWLNDYNQSKDELEFEKKLDYFIKSANFEFLKNNKPNLTKEVLKATSDFIPFSKVNPISIYSSCKSIKDAYVNKRDLGWLFFIQEAFAEANKN